MEQKDNLKENRETFSSKIGFVLSCIGSAIGIGSIWLFPYRLGEYGGATFLFVYILFVIAVGFSGVIGEIAFGRATKSGPIGAFKKAVESKTGKSWGKYLGMIPVLGALCMAIGYSVVVGWILKYLIRALLKISIYQNTSEYFINVSSGNKNFFYHIFALIITFIIILGGVSKGIEKANKIMMPIFFALFLFLAVWIFFLPNSGSG